MKKWRKNWTFIINVNMNILSGCFGNIVRPRNHANKVPKNLKIEKKLTFTINVNINIPWCSISWKWASVINLCFNFTAETEPHEGKRKVESLWPIFRLHYQRSRYIFDLFYKRKAISRGMLYDLVEFIRQLVSHASC